MPSQIRLFQNKDADLDAMLVAASGHLDAGSEYLIPAVKKYNALFAPDHASLMKVIGSLSRIRKTHDHKQSNGPNVLVLQQMAYHLLRIYKRYYSELNPKTPWSRFHVTKAVAKYHPHVLLRLVTNLTALGWGKGTKTMLTDILEEAANEQASVDNSIKQWELIDKYGTELNIKKSKVEEQLLTLDYDVENAVINAPEHKRLEAERSHIQSSIDSINAEGNRAGVYLSFMDIGGNDSPTDKRYFVESLASSAPAASSSRLQPKPNSGKGDRRFSQNARAFTST